YVQAGAIDVQGIRSETVLQTAFHGEDYFLSMYEAGFKTKIRGKEGNYRFTLFHDPTRLSRHDRGGTENDNLAFGVSFDQMITDKIGAFFRYGVTYGDVRTFGNTWSLGGTAKGLLPMRPKDVLGVGFCQGITDGSYRDRYNASSSESIFEAYYKIQVTDWCWIYPDVEVVLNPGANSHNDVSVVAGLRVKLEF
ncbi:MAG: carbohydrate porin, partial [Phycisphaerae bacterium]|nr:carbohydrate porin [Phycisphaerae bacterium]